MRPLDRKAFAPSFSSLMMDRSAEHSFSFSLGLLGVTVALLSMAACQHTPVRVHAHQDRRTGNWYVETEASNQDEAVERARYSAQYHCRQESKGFLIKAERVSNLEVTPESDSALGIFGKLIGNPVTTTAAETSGSQKKVDSRTVVRIDFICQGKPTSTSSN